MQANPVAELGRLYKLVNQLVDYRESLQALPAAKRAARASGRRKSSGSKRSPKSGDKAADKKAAQALAKAQDSREELAEEIAALEKKIAGVESDPQLAQARRSSMPTSTRPSSPKRPSSTPAMPRTSGCGTSSCPTAATRSPASIAG